MARDRTPRDGDGAELLGQFETAISGLGVDELKALLPQIFAAAGVGDGLDGRTPPSRRRARRTDVVTYRVRIDLNGTKPPLWRRLELASDLRLDEVHEVVQAAFGWTDSHLHQFGSGPSYYSRETEYYLCPFQAEEGETGIPEEQVRLDEVLAEKGDRLFYMYDFGDDWEHTLKLEAVLPRDARAPRAVCTDGRREDPHEDCGGVGGYELIVAATDPTYPDHADAVAEYARVFGDEVDPAAYAPTPFDLAETNAALASLAGAPSDLPEPLEELLHAARTEPARRRLRALIAAAGLDRPVLIDAAVAERMVRPYLWLLDRVGGDGIKLTGAGYLPPAEVEAAVAGLGLLVWGKGNREVETLPVLHLRESAQKAGLLRKHRGMLSLTARGRAVRTDPVAVWWQLAERTPPPLRDRCEAQAGLLALVLVAGGDVGNLHETIAELLGAIGWMASDGTPMTGSMASQAAWATTAVFRQMGALAGWGVVPPHGAEADGASFARAALRTWPGGRG